MRMLALKALLSMLREASDEGGQLKSLLLGGEKDEAAFVDAGGGWKEDAFWAGGGAC